MDWLGLTHFATALLALSSGAVVVFGRKGTRFHRNLGRVYFGSMLALNISALSIYDLFGGFGAFHFAALVSLVTVVLGVRSAWMRHANWRFSHAYWMSWSYVGLVAAAVAESATRYLKFDFGLTVAIASLMVFVIGAMLIRWRLPPLLRAN